MGIVEQYLSQLNTSKRRFRRCVAGLAALSLLVVLAVSWNLRQTGVAIANDATCGIEEHQHAPACIGEKTLICGYDGEVPTTETAEAPTETPTEVPTDAATEAPTEEPAEMPTEALAEEGTDEHIHSDACYEITYLCGLEEHIHDFSCYADMSADLEDWDIWAASIPELTGRISEDIVLVAQAQLGCKESELNFELAEDGQTRNGITRYGQWYGNPYGAWSNMFTSFCLRYAGLMDVPINSGAEKMQLEWEKLNLYRHAGGYEPVAGDIVFLDKNQNGVPESSAVVVGYFDFILTVIEGDVDSAVIQQEYRIDDPMITGYGITNPRGTVMMFAAAAADEPKTLGQTATYSKNLLTNGGTFILYTTGSDGKHYAIDGNGAAVEIRISSTGAITANVENVNMLYWTFEKANNYDNKSAFYICNVATGMYLHPNGDQGAAGSLHTGKWETALYPNGNGVRLRGARQNAYALLSGDKFAYAATQNAGSTFYFGKAPEQLVLWLDGTNGDIMSYRGSNDTKYTVFEGAQMQLPSTWKSPTKYHYKLAGWVNIKTGDYYRPGDTITVTENTVLYADWVANSYDIGVYNSQVADTISTNDFITTRVFDYSSLINLLSTKVNVNVSSTSHSETWSHVGSGNVTYKGQTTLDFSFNDHDGSGSITNLNSLNAANKYTGGAKVHEGIYNDNLGDVLFGTNNLFDPETGKGIVGKHYLGEGDHLFQINNDPTSEYYGYYYYDADLNAAAYNQSDQRFYVYDYLVKASDSGSNDYSDFLPLNSAYTNNNEQTVKTYTHNGVTNYSFESGYGSNDNAKANLWFGMRVDIRFDLPDAPGDGGTDKVNDNKDIYGNDMHFHFTGDDDVWILIDGKVVLDLGGIHQAVDGDINFATGEVHVNGEGAGTLQGVEPGERTLSVLYLERGASMSNCAIYFNLAPRFSMTLQKEDVLTQELLDGAIFGFYYDQACTQKCALWPSQESYRKKDNGIYQFTVTDGKLYVWGLSPSRTYYIREEKPPDDNGYEVSKGVIRLTLDKNGLNSYSATILPPVDTKGNVTGSVSHGFTVHGFRIDEKNQAAYVSITNAQNWVTETTSVYVEKKWMDLENHNGDAVTVYLNVTDAKGNVRRLRQITLSKENDWKYEWANLPKYVQADDGSESDIPVSYSVSEAYVPGYTAQVIELRNGEYEDIVWVESGGFTSSTNGATFLLKTDMGYLATESANSNSLCFIASEEEAEDNPLARWVATVSSGKVKLTNEKKQILTYSNNTYRIAKNGNQSLTFKDNLLYYSTGAYMGSTFDKSNYLEAKNDAAQALKIYPMMEIKDKYSVSLSGYGYRVNNIPLATETSLKVTKGWNHPANDATLYEKEQITIRLLANGVDTGRAETVSLKNNWEVTFNGLPYLDAAGDPIRYTVVEIMESEDWIPVYGEIVVIDNQTGNPTYETTVTNHYRWTNAVELPATGGTGYPIYILIGLILISAPFVYGFSLRRRYERRTRQ